MFESLAKLESVYDYTDVECHPYLPHDHGGGGSGSASGSGSDANGSGANGGGSSSGGESSGASGSGFNGSSGSGDGALGPILARAFIVPAEGITAQQLAVQARGGDHGLPSARCVAVGARARWARCARRAGLGPPSACPSRSLWNHLPTPGCPPPALQNLKQGTSGSSPRASATTAPTPPGSPASRRSPLSRRARAPAGCASPRHDTTRARRCRASPWSGWRGGWGGCRRCTRSATRWGAPWGGGAWQLGEAQEVAAGGSGGAAAARGAADGEGSQPRARPTVPGPPPPAPGRARRRDRRGPPLCLHPEAHGRKGGARAGRPRAPGASPSVAAAAPLAA
jgi:hypothetical protein